MDKYKIYEEIKKKLIGLEPKEYEEIIKIICEELGI